MSYCKPFGAACALVLITWLSSCTNAPYCWWDLSQAFMLQSHLMPSVPVFALLAFAYCLWVNPLCASSRFVITGNTLLFFYFSHMLSFWDLSPSFTMAIKVERFFGHTVSVGWELCRIHIVLAHALLSAVITGAVSLHSKLQAQVPSMPSKTAIFFSSQASLAVMDYFSCSIELSNLPLVYQTGPFSPSISPV